MLGIMWTIYSGACSLEVVVAGEGITIGTGNGDYGLGEVLILQWVWSMGVASSQYRRWYGTCMLSYLEPRCPEVGTGSRLQGRESNG